MTVDWHQWYRQYEEAVAIRRWFADAGFDEVAFDAPTKVEWSVGVHRLTAGPRPFAPAAAGLHPPHSLNAEPPYRWLSVQRMD
jgi:hypothetical protein